MRWRAVVSGALGVAALLSVLVAFWPRATTAEPWYSVPADAQPLLVSDVLSGDTVVLISDRPGPQIAAWGAITTRLIGLDAPNFGITAECYAVEAQARLSTLLPKGTLVWVTTDTTKRDDNGRWLTYLWTADGRLTNALLPEDGYSRTQDPGTNRQLWPQIESAGARAASRFGGLWNACR